MDMKLRPDDVTPRQWTESQKQLQAKLKSEAKARGEEYEGGKKEVRDFIEKQALAAGVEKSEAKANAKLVSEFAGTMALRLGVSVQEAAALGSLGQLRISGPKGETVRAARSSASRSSSSPRRAPARAAPAAPCPPRRARTSTTSTP
jgi:hypothetical protein